MLFQMLFSYFYVYCSHYLPPGTSPLLKYQAPLHTSEDVKGSDTDPMSVL